MRYMATSAKYRYIKNTTAIPVAIVLLPVYLITLVWTYLQIRTALKNTSFGIISFGDHDFAFVVGAYLWILVGIPRFLKTFLWTGKLSLKEFFHFTPQQAIFLISSASMIAGIALLSDNFYCWSVSVALFAGTYIVSGYLLLQICLTNLMRLFDVRMQRQAPVSSLALALFDALWLLERNHRWHEPSHRAEIVRALDDAASIIRTRLFRDFSISNYVIRTERDQRASQIAESLREKELWLVTPKEDTRQILITNLSQMLAALLTGNWDDFDTRKSISHPRLNRVGFIISALRTFFIGTLPILILFTGEYLLHIEIESPLRGYIQIATLLWAALTFMSGLDPSIKDKVSEMKDLLSLSTRSDKK